MGLCKKIFLKRKHKLRIGNSDKLPPTATLIQSSNATTQPNSNEGNNTTPDNNSKNWHHMAIRRNLSKQKELVLYVSSLPAKLHEDAYHEYAAKCIRTDKVNVGPVFAELGCFFVTFKSGTAASNAMKKFQNTQLCGESPKLHLLPYIHMPTDLQDSGAVDPLVVFINPKSGERQGSTLYQSMLDSLNDHQIFLLDKGGALPGLYAFRKMPRFRVMICGGDGTVGWVLTHIELAQPHLTCKHPPVAVLPMGTGNDLARVLGFGPGYSGESVPSLLSQIVGAEPVEMDRWNIIFDCQPVQTSQDQEGPGPVLLSNAVSVEEESQRDSRGDSHAPSSGSKQKNGGHRTISHVAMAPVQVVQSVGSQSTAPQPARPATTQQVDKDETTEENRRRLVHILSLEDDDDDAGTDTDDQPPPQQQNVTPTTGGCPTMMNNDVIFSSVVESSRGGSKEKIPPSIPTNTTGLKVSTMNNYFGIGIDAELSLAFHLAREENPEKCTSRLRNKALYFKAGLKKMVSKSINLNHVLEIEVDHHKIELPSIKGLIFLNIASWAAGTKPWGSAASKRFQSPGIGDGLLEVIGVNGVPHMSSIYSGIRSATRIAQGEFIKITLKAEVAVQIDGEPWIQPPGTIIISLCPYRPKMLKPKAKRKRFSFAPNPNNQ